MNRLEKFFYEMRPLFLLLVAIAASIGPEPISKFGKVSIALLGLSSLLIFYWRYQYRAAPQLRRR